MSVVIDAPPAVAWCFRAAGSRRACRGGLV